MRKRKLMAVMCAAACFAWTGRAAYAAPVSDSDGDAVEAAARPPMITVQPHDTTVNLGGTAFFSVEAQGENLTYQWYIRKSNARAWTKWKNHTDPETVATANATWNGMQIFCLVGDAQGNTVSSEPALITVRDLLSIVRQPQSASAAAGGTAVFSVRASGTEPRYQWYYKRPGSADWTKLRGHTDAETSLYADPAWDGVLLRCAVTNAAGRTVLSVPAELRVPSGRPQNGRFPASYASRRRGASPVITSQPQDASAGAGEPVSFSVSADGARLTYRWYIKKAGAADWTRLIGHEDSDIRLTAESDWGGMLIRCGVTDGGGREIFSDAAQVAIDENFSIVTQPADTSAEVGQDIRLSVKATGSGLRYRWYYYTDDTGEWREWQGLDTSRITVRAQKRWYGLQAYCDVRDMSGRLLQSQPAAVDIPDAFRIVSSPEDVCVPVGEEVWLRTEASGHGLHYQWYYRKKGMSRWHKWKGHTGAVTHAAANETWERIQFYCEVTDCDGDTISSAPAMITLADENES